MADLARLFDFTDGQTIVADEVDAELNQIIARLNDVPADSLIAALATILGVSQTGVTRRGKSIITTEESRTNTAYGLLPTFDQVANVVLPTDGLIFVTYQAMWKESVSAAARAAIFLTTGSADQVKRAEMNAAVPAVQEASNTALANTYKPLYSSVFGLKSQATDSTPYTGDVTTGQIVGSGDFAGPSIIDAAAGTYDISVRFKASSGSVTAKNRKLRVWTMGF